MADALWIGVDGIGVEGVESSVNVFRKNGETFELVKIFSGEEAEKIYKILTEGGEESLVSEVNL